MNAPDPSALLAADAFTPARDWFASQGWTPFAFQENVWSAYARGESGLIHAPTGMGKTYAAWLGPLLTGPRGEPGAPPPLTVLWLTPLRALAQDTGLSLARAAAALNPHWTVGVRTGDTASADKAKQERRLPTALVTTPESLTLLQSRPDWREHFAHVQAVVVDEWHELMSSKRGVQVELALARLRSLRTVIPAQAGTQRRSDDHEGTTLGSRVRGNDGSTTLGSRVRGNDGSTTLGSRVRGNDEGLRVWALSATLANLDEALACLIGPAEATNGRIVEGIAAKEIVIDTARPATIERFPWGGHIGTKLLPQVVKAIDNARSTLVFTNVRSATEIWYQALLTARPDWAGQIALHHGSLERGVRDWVEEGLRSRRLRAVVCTSSLDLGVDYTPVEQVLQIGSPKGVARLLQRAGRSGHQPGAVSRITVVPTQALELVEAAAAREAALERRIEPRTPMIGPLDTLVQHLVTAALGGGFRPDELLAEIRTTNAYAHLTDADWQWALDFVVHGGASLNAYPEYRRVVLGSDGIAHVPDRQIARRHRTQIGTIVSDSSITVQMRNGRKLGHVEESFIAMLSPGDCFVFAGRVLEFLRVREMTAWVRPAPNKSPVITRWMGAKMPLSSLLSERTRRLIAAAKQGRYESPELQLVRPLLQLQARWSALPDEREWLCERIKLREGHYVFFYPFEGRLAHLGLATLFSYRLSKMQPRSFSIMMNDYGFGLLSPTPVDLGLREIGVLLAAPNVEADILAGLNAAELGRRQFREIARVAGLVFQGYPGQPQSNRQLQASSGLLWDVFNEYDPDNLLLKQATREVLERQLEAPRLEKALARMRGCRVIVTDPQRPTPFAFPLMVEAFREKLTTEALETRVGRMVADLEKAAGTGP